MITNLKHIRGFVVYVVTPSARGPNLISRTPHAFLPTDDDRMKAQINELQVRLNVATEKRRQLRRALIEEDLSHVVVSRLTDMIKDPTRTKASELEGMQKEIFDQLVRVAEQCTSKEIFSYYRLAGSSVFSYNENMQVVTLETFYNKVYRESFKICMDKEAQQVLYHSLPQFIPVDELVEQFLPHDLETFLRLVHDAAQAFVVRRELWKDLERTFKIQDLNVSFTHGVVEVTVAPERVLLVTLTFSNYQSSFPTDILVRPLFRVADEGREAFRELQRDLMMGDIQGVLTALQRQTEF
ncbi:uncharacterized protein EV154DRAFT_508296 [Mucor mucedo]|uniref:uncharacterized protein n=1 Tax=Mucor mucedo TaxID=29922 RepID=UPI002220D765|nr:uncharacterized protein EV154DRAFT_508296 [Mucor mucedo]KAI7891440.1 hypothetical protein EV154DRAFT_508296 [Mucor mucedo]